MFNAEETYLYFYMSVTSTEHVLYLCHKLYMECRLCFCLRNPIIIIMIIIIIIIIIIIMIISVLIIITML